jgi:hypothetical protein
MNTRFTTALVALAALLAWAAPARADHNRHVGPDGALRSPQTEREAALDFNLRIDAHGFRLGGRVLGLDRPYGAWLGGEVRDRSLTLDGRLEGRPGWRLHLDGDTLEGAARDVGVAARQLARDLAERYLTRP